MIKGWAVHHQQVDRYFFYSGSLKLVLYDARESSPTRGMINELYFSEANRSLVAVPPGVYHAVENVGTTDALMINFPSEPYRHEVDLGQRPPLILLGHLLPHADIVYHRRDAFAAPRNGLLGFCRRQRHVSVPPRSRKGRVSMMRGCALPCERPLDQFSLGTIRARIRRADIAGHGRTGPVEHAMEALMLATA